MNPRVDLNTLLDISSVNVKFQPIVSVVKKSVIGFSSLCTGGNLASNFLSMPELLHYAEKFNLEIHLDRLIREKIIEESNNLSDDVDKLLFISINMNVIAKSVGSGVILDLVNKFNINPKRVVLEIYENNLEDEDALKQFINCYRSRGFLISLTIGSGISALDKIFYVKPDIIKIAEPVTIGIEMDFYKQEIFKSLVNLSKKISALVIADGINIEDQAIISMELGADMLQGNYFGRYQDVNPRILNTANKRVDNIASLYKNYKTEQIEFEQLRHRRYEELLTTVISELSIIEEFAFDQKLTQLINKYDILECAYVLNKSGVQVSDTIPHLNKVPSKKSIIFKPAIKGTDHSLKKYYYLLKNMGLSKYSTEEYLSLASGNLCITISEKFGGLSSTDYILCIDFNPTNVDR
ncbi:MAG: EAL domain-containing protein [Clostridiaceae bacterium]|nr:EAL domain-containing protein [Clostridiaceae bacterium]